MSDQSFICPNCRADLMFEGGSFDEPLNCGSCEAKVLFVPTLKRLVPEISMNARTAFIGILAVTAIIGAMGACMLMGGWNFWATLAIIGGMVYLMEKLFLNKYYLIKMEEYSDGDGADMYVAANGQEFNELVNEAVAELPKRFKNELKDITIVVEDVPGNAIVEKMKLPSNRSLAGLYQGIPLTHRSVWHGNRLPDKITVYRKNIEGYCRTEAQLKREIKRVVRHELGHFFGLNEDDLREIEKSSD